MLSVVFVVAIFVFMPFMILPYKVHGCQINEVSLPFVPV